MAITLRPGNSTLSSRDTGCMHSSKTASNGISAEPPTFQQLFCNKPVRGIVEHSRLSFQVLTNSIFFVHFALHVATGRVLHRSNNRLQVSSFEVENCRKGQRLGGTEAGKSLDARASLGTDWLERPLMRSAPPTRYCRLAPLFVVGR